MSLPLPATHSDPTEKIPDTHRAEPWYLLNFIAPAIRRSEILDTRIRTYNTIHGTDLRVFAPQVVEAQPAPDGGLRIIKRPILYHYIFVQGPLPHVKRFCSEGEGLSFVLRHPDALPSSERISAASTPAGAKLVSTASSARNIRSAERISSASTSAGAKLVSAASSARNIRSAERISSASIPAGAKLVSAASSARNIRSAEENPAEKISSASTSAGAKLVSAASSARYVSLSDAEIQAFRIIARAYSNRLPYYRPTDIDLIDGDEVEVVSGPFAGLKGTFIARRGTPHGNIIVNATGQIGSIAYNIKADTIRILRFAKDSRRAYDQIDAFLPKLRAALEVYRANQSLTPAQAAPLNIFTRRFAVTDIPGAKLDAKLQALLAVANEILGNREAAAQAMERYRKRLPHVTNPATIALLRELIPSPDDDTASPRTTADTKE